MFCTKCGAKNADDASFCEQCGAPLCLIDTNGEQVGSAEFAEYLCA